MRFKSTTNYPTSTSHLASSASQTRFVSIRAQNIHLLRSQVSPFVGHLGTLHCATHGPTSRSHGVGAHKPIKKGLGRKTTAVVHPGKKLWQTCLFIYSKKGMSIPKKMETVPKILPEREDIAKYVLEDVHGWFSFRTRVAPKLVGQCQMKDKVDRDPKRI